MTDTVPPEPDRSSTNDDPADDTAAAKGDPTDTDHPTGEKQAADNIENEPAG